MTGQLFTNSELGPVLYLRLVFTTSSKVFLYHPFPLLCVIQPPPSTFSTSPSPHRFLSHVLHLTLFQSFIHDSFVFPSVIHTSSDYIHFTPLSSLQIICIQDPRFMWCNLTVCAWIPYNLPFILKQLLLTVEIEILVHFLTNSCSEYYDSKTLTAVHWVN